MHPKQCPRCHARVNMVRLYARWQHKGKNNWEKVPIWYCFSCETIVKG